MKVFLLFVLFFGCGELGYAQRVEGSVDTPLEIRRVLFVSSYHPEQVWERKVLNGVRKQLERTGYNIDLRVVYLDSKRLTSTEVRNSLLEAQLREIKGKLDNCFGRRGQ